MAGAAVALVFAVPIVTDVIGSAHAAWWKAAALALLAAFFATYVVGPALTFSASLARRTLVLSLMAVLSLALFAFLDVGASGLWIYLGVAAAMLIPARAAVVLAVLLAGMTVLLTQQDSGGASWEQALILLSITGLMIGFAGNIRLTRELRDTREELADAAVAAERARIGRDLHDILGHSLTAITVKAGLARRLTALDPAAAAAEIADVERLAREALTDVRATASGFREVSLGSELAVSASVLRAAGIRAELPTAVDDVVPAARELFGYVVREAVTNAVRHSGAAMLGVTVGPRWVEIVDDGVGGGFGGGNGPTGGSDASGQHDGCGLAGLRDRVLASAGRLEAGPRAEGGFRVRVTVPVAVGPVAVGPVAVGPTGVTPASVGPAAVGPTGVAPASVGPAAAPAAGQKPPASTGVAGVARRPAARSGIVSRPARAEPVQPGARPVGPRP